MNVLSISSIWSTAWPILFAILFFAFIIFFHELGHFLAAKWMGVRVNEFAIGMGPKIFGFGKKETKYSLRAFPIGGYCAMEGEDEESDDDRAFGKKPIWRRIIIIAAGAFMNIVLGFLILAIILASQGTFGTRNVSKFHENASSYETGLREGDKIININGMHVYSNFDISMGLMRDSDGVVDMTVKRDGETVKLTNVTFQTTQYEDEKGRTQISIVYDFYVSPAKGGFFSVISAAAGETVSLARLVYISLYDLVTGQFGFSDLSGPIGTIGIVAESASQGLSTVMFLLAFITINIGVFNLLPVPALDGGRLFFLIIQGITRKKINPKYEAIINTAGLVLLVGLIMVVSVSDVINLFRG